MTICKTYYETPRLKMEAFHDKVTISLIDEEGIKKPKEFKYSIYDLENSTNLREILSVLCYEAVEYFAKFGEEDFQFHPVDYILLTRAIDKYIQDATRISEWY